MNEQKRNKVIVKKEYQTLKHGFDPVFDPVSRIMILGSFPSVKSREMQFFYGHPQNRFWKVISALFHEEIPNTIEQKIQLLQKHHIALWDVIAQCDIIGSSDSSIKNVIPNDVNRLVEQSQIEQIYVNGKTAKKLYDKYLYDKTGMEAIVLPSTSPANAAYSFDRLLEEWKRINQAD